MLTPTVKRAAAALLIVLAARTLSRAADWPQWRGPQRDGVASSFRGPKSWPDQLTKKWEVEVGEGHASPVVARGRVYQHSRQGEREIVSALDLRTGRLLWRESYDAPYTPDRAAIKHGKGPHSTPVVAGGRLYTFGMTGIVSCYDAATGRLRWRKEYSQEFKKSSPDYGTAASPVVDSGLLITYVGGKDSGALVALDAATGRERWRWAGDGPGYCSPVVFELGGVRQVVVLSQQNIVSAAVATGELLWQMPFKTEWDNSIVTPVQYKDTLIFSAVGKETLAVRPARRDGKWSVDVVWRNPQQDMYMSSPVLSGDYLFGMSPKRRGQYFCLDARTGAALWTTEGQEGANAAILRSGPTLFLLGDDAELTVAAADERRYAPLKKYTVAQSPTWAHPVLLGEQILIKDSSKLILWSL